MILCADFHVTSSRPFYSFQDKCCPADRAKFHWLTAYEVCLPNVRVDLSGLRFTVHTVTHGSNPLDVVTIDLNDDRSWDHSCQQGADVIQFPYLPGEDEVNNGDSEENTGKRR